MNTYLKTLRRVGLFGIAFLTAVVLVPVNGVTAQDQREKTPLKTFDEMPETAAKFKLNNGKEMYFFEGDLYAFVDGKAVYVAIPTDGSVMRGPRGRAVADRYRATRQHPKNKKWNHARRRYARAHVNQQKKQFRKAARRHEKWHRHEQWHRQNDECIRRG